MLACDLPCNPSLHNSYPLDLSTMSEEASTPIHDADSSPEHEHQSQNVASNPHNDTTTSTTTTTPIPSRSQRPSRACTARAAGRFYAPPVIERKPKPAKKDRLSDSPPQQCGSNSRIVTPLMNSPPPSQLPRWSLRSMWELASILNFLHVFRPLLNINVEFSAEEFETALVTPNDTLGDIHIPLLKAIPPVTRMALGRGTWVTVLCRKLRDWWHWVADGELPIVASHGAEIEVYNTLEPGVRVVILKALCDIRVEQEDIRNYIDNSIKHGVQLSAFRKERVGGDSQGISYWYEDDPIIGHRLYREIRKIEVKKVKARGVHSLPIANYQWETVATNLDEFQDVSEKLFSSKNRTEASLGKKLKNDMLPEIEKVHKRKEKLLKKQHREALLLDNFLGMDGLGTAGRSLRDRKPVTYTFDDYDRSINEAIKITKRKQPSPEPTVRREFVPKPEAVTKPEASTNGRWSGPSPSQPSQDLSFNAPSPNSPDDNFIDEEDHMLEPLDRGNRRRQRPQRYSEKEFVEDVSDNEAGFDSDDDIVGEAVYDEEYLKKRKQKKASSSSEGEGDEEYRGDEENAEDEEEEEEEDESLSMSEDSDNPRRRRFKKLSGRTRRETKLRSVDEIQSGLRRSRRATRTRINYRQIEFSESDSEPNIEPEKSNASSDDMEYQQDSDGNDDDVEMKVVDKPPPPPEKLNSSGENEVEIGRERRFLDLNELAPGSGFEDGPNMVMKDDDRDDL